jgi:hypothetical protein
MNELYYFEGEVVTGYTGTWTLTTQLLPLEFVVPSPQTELVQGYIAHTQFGWAKFTLPSEDRDTALPKYFSSFKDAVKSLPRGAQVVKLED